MNNIEIIQNEQKQLERLAAQRELYSSAKRKHGWQIILTVIIPVCFAVVSFFNPQLSVIAAIFGLASFIIDISLIEPNIKRQKNKAAKIQEIFDCDVLELPRSPLKIIDDIAVEEVLLHYNAHIKIKSNVEKIRNWYTGVSLLPITIARILCQRKNCWWDFKLKERYSNFLKISGIIVFAGMLVIGILLNSSLITITLIASGLVPFFQFCIKQYNDNQEAAKRLNELMKFIQNLWYDALHKNKTDQQLIVDSRRLQDEIFEHRSKSPLILDYYYGLFRKKDDEIMNRAIDILKAEALTYNTSLFNFKPISISL